MKRATEEFKNADREYDFSLFQYRAGEEQPREPLPAEVGWLPHFDPALCEVRGNNTKSQREKLQKQFLSDAYIFLAARDPKHIKDLEKKLHNPEFRRWQSWFEEAKKFKKKQRRHVVSHFRLFHRQAKLTFLAARVEW